MLCPTSAEAHLVTTGLGPLYDSVSHFALSPETWLAAIALAIAAGLRGAAPGRWVLFMVPLAWIGGDLLGRWMAPLPEMPFAAIGCLGLGIFAAADSRFPTRAFGAIALATGFVLGMISSGPIRDVEGWVLQLLGQLASVSIIIALVAGFVVTLERQWTRIVARVAGSWIAAIGLLMIGWAARR